MVSTIIGAVCNIALNYILISNIGIIGASLATMISFLMVWIVRATVLKNFLRLEINYIKVTTSIFIMIISALYYSYDLPLKYLVYSATIVSILFVYAKEIKVIIKLFFNYVQKHRLKRKVNKS